MSLYLPAYVVGTILVEVLATVFLHIICAIISAILRRRVAPPPTPIELRLRPTVSGFFVFLAVMVSNVVQGLRNRLLAFSRRGWTRPAPTNQTQGVLFTNSLFKEPQYIKSLGSKKCLLYFIEMVSFESSNLNTLASKKL